MSDKTCGTCANGKPALVRCTVHGDEFPWLKKRNEACDDFCERADSLEAVALDAYDLVKRAISALAMTTTGVEATDAAVIDLVQDETAICSRLEDLGVKQKWSLS